MLKTEDLLPIQEAEITALQTIVQEAILTLILATISSPSHITSKLIWEGVFVSWTLHSMSKFVVAIENHCIAMLSVLDIHDLCTLSPIMLIAPFYQSI